MKRMLTVILTIVLTCSMAGCGEKTMKGSEVYSFPEPTTELRITHSYYSQDDEHLLQDNKEILSILNWFYKLELAEVQDEPENVAGSEAYIFYMKDECVFSYEDRGVEAFIYLDDKIYEVKNPTAPVLE